MNVEKAGKIALVNLITASRYALSLLALYELSRGGFIVSVGLIGLAWLTDVADGKLARRWDVKTKFGAINDALADGICFGSAMTAFASSLGLSNSSEVFIPMSFIFGTGRLMMEIK